MARAIWLPPPAEPTRWPKGLDPLLVRILANRGIVSDEEIDNFLNAYLRQIRKPKDLPDILAARDLLTEAIDEGWPVRIITDYDVDGIMSGALLLLWLRGQYVAKGQDPSVIDCVTPSRFDEGYGLNQNHILNAALDGKKLVITCDCGIRSHAEGDLARELGLRLIITDHHEPDESGIIPHADAVVNPKRHDSQYPFRDICGCMVALKLAWAVGGSLRALLPYFDLVAMATIADMVPLVDENRAAVIIGLDVINECRIPVSRDQDVWFRRRPALQMLFGDEAVSDKDLAWIAIPQLNALGRMGDANRGIRFLTEVNGVRLEEILVLEEILAEIKEANGLRQALQRKLIDEVAASIEGQPSAIVYSSPFKHLGPLREKVEGVLGIVAARIGEKFNCPTVILVEKEDGTARGSARAIIDIDLHKTLSEIDHLLLKWGGHKAAAGLSIRTADVPALREHLQKAVEQLSWEDRMPKLQIDAVLDNRDPESVLPVLELLAPFGTGNPKPLFLIEKARVRRAGPLRDGSPHLKLDLEFDKYRVDAIGWNSWEAYEKEGCPTVLDLVVEIEPDLYRGGAQLVIRDWEAIV